MSRVTVNKCVVIGAALFLMLMLIPGLLLAAESEQSIRAAQSVTSTDHILKTLLGLIAVLLLIFVLAWLVKKYSGFSPMSNSMVKLVAGVSVGQKERVVLLQVGERQILVGVAPGSINMLYLLDEGSELKVDAKAAPKSIFADKFKNSLKKIETKT